MRHRDAASASYRAVRFLSCLTSHRTGPYIRRNDTNDKLPQRRPWPGRRPPLPDWPLQQIGDPASRSGTERAKLQAEKETGRCCSCRWSIGDVRVRCQL